MLSVTEKVRLATRIWLRFGRVELAGCDVGPAPGKQGHEEMARLP